MIKLLGSVLILAAGAGLGFYQAALLARRPRQIRQLLGVLKRLETEIHYGYTPLPNALRSAGRNVSPPIAAMLNDAAERLESSNGTTEEVWRAAADKGWPRTALGQPERDAWLTLGATLGASGRDDQLKHLRLAESHLQAEEHSAAEEQKRFENMWKSLGVLGGALVVILMY